MASVFDTIKRNAGDLDRSNSWYRSQVNRIASGTTAQQLFRQGKLARRPSVGRLNLFGYNPKLRKTLPYYDVFPLILPLEAFSGGFIGMNFHYLPPLLRMRLLERMQATATDRDFDKDTKFIIHGANIDGGSSGGPLFDADGNLIGLNTATSMTAAENIAVSADHVRDLLYGN